MQTKTRQQAADTHLNNAYYLCEELKTVSEAMDETRYLDFLLLSYGFYHEEFQRIAVNYCVDVDNTLFWMCFSHAIISVVENPDIDKIMFYNAIKYFSQHYRYKNINTFDKHALKFFLLGGECYREGIDRNVARFFKSHKSTSSFPRHSYKH